MQVSTQVNDYVLIFRDRSKMFVPKRINDFIIEQSYKPNSDKVRVGDTIIALRDISKILPITDFYEQYPSERPDRKYEEVRGNPWKWEGVKNKAHLVKIMEGMKRYIDSTKENPLVNHSCASRQGCECGVKVYNRETGIPEKMYEKMRVRLES